MEAFTSTLVLLVNMKTEAFRWTAPDPDWQTRQGSRLPPQRPERGEGRWTRPRPPPFLFPKCSHWPVTTSGCSQRWPCVCARLNQCVDLKVKPGMVSIAGAGKQAGMPRSAVGHCCASLSPFITSVTPDRAGPAFRKTTQPTPPRLPPCACGRGDHSTVG